MGNSKTSPALGAAFRYIKLGLPVIPIRPPQPSAPGAGKAPLTLHGYKDATTKRAKVRLWFHRHTEANVAIVTGERAGVIVLDIDDRHGGREALRALEETLGKLPTTWTARTGGGGSHLYFAYPDFRVGRDTAGKWLQAGIDVIGEGGYVVAPPSHHASRKRYRWAKDRGPNEVELAALPPRWLAYLEERIHGRPDWSSIGPQSSPNVEPILEPMRNATLTSLAGKLRRSGLGFAEILAALGVTNANRCRPPFDQSELEKIARSIAGYPSANEANGSSDVALGVARNLFAAEYADGKHLMFLSDGQFWAFTGKCWEPLSLHSLKRKILQLIEATVTDTRPRFAALTREVIALLEPLASITGDPLRFMSAPPRVLNCKNGELWLRDGTVELKPHRAESYLRHVLDVSYDPEATCPEYDKAVWEIFANASNPAAMIRHWHELVGYVIQPTRPHALIAVLMGSGSNGKTKLIQTVMNLLGPDTVYAGRVDELESDRFAIGNLLGELVFVDDDVSMGTKLPDGALKKISEEKILTGERKFKDRFSFKSRAVPVLLCNNVPSLADLSHGMLRRLQVVPFNRCFVGKEDDKYLFSRIWAHEMSGTLNRAIEGWKRLHGRGDFKIPKDMRATCRDWLAQANPLEGFLAEMCELDATAKCRMTIFYEKYCDWARAYGFTRVQQRLKVKKNLIHRGFAFDDGNQGQMLFGIRLKPDPK